MEKIKLFFESEKGKDILIVIIVILVGLISFELGRLSKQANNSGINIEYNGQKINALNQPANVISATQYSPEMPLTANNNRVVNTNNIDTTNKSFFASNKGKKYYTTGCGAGKTIKQENKIYFTTAEEAQKAGYELSSSCNL